MKSIFNNRFIILGRNARRFLEKQLFFTQAKKEVLRRSKISFEDINAVTKDISFSYLRAYTPEINENNDLYGMAYNLKKYTGIKQEVALKASIEHGASIGNYIWEMDIANKLPYLLTLSQYRVGIITKKTNKKAEAIGPILHYSKGYMTDNQIKEKKYILGKNLTFFPAHSSHLESVNQNYSELCKQIKKISSNFDTVTICAYWKNYLDGEIEIFKKNGFKCVSAGHIFDPYFLPRLKSIIELSSVTASNEVGTILGYSISMNKPHFLIDLGKVKNRKLDYNYNTEEYELEKLANEFLKYTDKITKKQRDLVNFYWGLDQVKTPSEIRGLFHKCEKTFNLQNKK